ncbi:immunity 53 family protein [Streptoverticillium reticulum]|uniref:immunity 53 family protein n=1 Tax=Streptoverticillium reticulum TaxID=1433415 RepID=UPI0039BF608E
MGDPQEESVTPLKALQEWYASNCDGDWEHSFGIRIETSDNPGWILVVDLERTSLYGRFCDKEDSSVDGSWISMKSDGREFVAACDPCSLDRAVDSFVKFAQ